MRDEDIANVIKECDWRRSLGRKARKSNNTLYFCAGMLGMCERVIDRGSCPTLKEYFGTWANLFAKEKKA